MAKAKYNFLNDNFLVYEAVETPKVELKMPLWDKAQDISSWAYGLSSTGIPLVGTFKPKEEESSEEGPKFIINNSDEIPDDFYTENVSFSDLLKQEGIHAKITSGYRENAVAANGKPSNHSIVNGAYDIVPLDGYSFEDLRKEIYSNPRIISWLQNKKWGILEETTPEIKSKTNATGNHWHFGPDPGALKQFNENLRKWTKSVG